MNDQNQHDVLERLLRAGAHGQANEHIQTCRKTAEDTALSASKALTAELAAKAEPINPWFCQNPEYLDKARELHQRALAAGKAAAFWSSMLYLAEEQRKAPDQVRQLLGRHQCFRCGRPQAWLYNRNPEYDPDNPGAWAMLCPKDWAYYHARPRKAKQHGYRLPTKHAATDAPSEYTILVQGRRALIGDNGAITILQPHPQTNQ